MISFLMFLFSIVKVFFSGGHLEIARLLLRYGADPNEFDGTQRNCFLWAVFYGYEEICVLLIDHGVTLCQEDSQRRSYLHIAILQNHLHLVRFLLHQGVDINTLDGTGRTPLLLATQKRFAHLSYFLLNQGADPEIKDKHGNRPLSWAAQYDDLVSVQMLLVYGAAMHSLDSQESSLLHIAVRHRNDAMIHEAVKAGADPFGCDGNGESPLELAKLCGVTSRFFEICNELSHGEKEKLSLSSLSLYRVPNFVWRHTSLRSLDLQHNQLTFLPEDVVRLSCLQVLNVAHNRLVSLPVELGEIPSLSSLIVDDNPLTSLPSPDLLPRKSAAILDFLRKLKKNDLIWKRMRVLVVGKENVGKTTLTARLVRSKKQRTHDKIGEDLSTEGIEVNQWNPNVDNKGIPPAAIPADSSDVLPTIFFYDFGGQEVFYPTHHFFLSPRALYLVVFRLDDVDMESSVDYWIHAIRSIKSVIQAPILIIGTHADLCSESRLDETRLLLTRKYPKIGVHFLSSSNQSQIYELRGVIFNFANMSPLKVRVSGSQLYLVKKLENMSGQVRTMTWQLFVDLSRECGILGAAVDHTVQLFHDLGVLLHFNDVLLDDENKVVILDPMWLVEVMTSIINVRTQHILRDGFATSSQLGQLLGRYPRSTQNQFLKILEAFGIIISLRSDSLARKKTISVSSRAPRLDRCKSFYGVGPIESIGQQPNSPLSSAAPSLRTPSEPVFSGSSSDVTSSSTKNSLSEALSLMPSDKSPTPASRSNRPVDYGSMTIRDVQKLEKAVYLVPCLLPVDNARAEDVWSSATAEEATYSRLYRFKSRPYGLLPRLIVKFVYVFSDSLVWRNGLVFHSNGYQVPLLLSTFLPSGLYFFTFFVRASLFSTPKLPRYS